MLTSDSSTSIAADHADYPALRRFVIDWLDDNFHFGDAERLISSDQLSFLKNGILDSLGFVLLILHLEKTFALKIDRKSIAPENFDGMAKIVTYIAAHPAYRGFQ
jgi:acyl carrier protein